MELKDFCEICIGKNGDDRECRICATAWPGTGTPPKFQAVRLLNQHGSSVPICTPGVIREIPSGVSISAYQTYTRDTLNTRLKLLNDIIAYAEAELNLISKYEGNNQ